MADQSSKEPSVDLEDALQQALAESPGARFLQRLVCVKLTCCGASCAQVARWFGRNPSTIARWTEQYAAFGVAGLQEDKKTGRLAALDFDQCEALRRDLACSPRRFGYKKPRWDGALVAQHLAHRFGITLSVRQCQRLLRQLEHAASSSRPQTSENLRKDA